MEDILHVGARPYIVENMIEGPRAVRPTELDAVVRLATSVFRREGDVDMRAAFPTLFNADNLENLQVMLEDGRPVALAGCVLRDLSLSGTKIRVGLVGSVCTLEEFRGQGLAGRVVTEVISRSAAQGAVAILVSGGRELYRRMGCVDAGLWRAVSVARSRALPRLKCDAAEWTTRDIPEMVALYQGEPIRFERGAEEMRTLLEARSLYARPSRAWLCRIGQRLAAYACTSGPEQGKGERVIKALEIAGSRHALLAALPRILSMSHAGSAEIETAASDLEMEALINAWDLPSVPRGFHGTVKIVDRPRFFSALEGHISLRLTRAERAALAIECGSAVAFRYEGAELSVADDADLAAFVFGSVLHAAPAANDGRLAEILARIFPLPLPGYGLNYI
jgi:predicted N-acetyltransferase YhbS